MAPAIPFRLQVVYALIATVLGLLVVEGLVSVLSAASAALGVTGISEESHCEYDGLLGWTNQRDIHLPDLYGPGRSYTTNSQGFRSTAGTYSREVPAGKYRIIALGDSFTMGYGVSDDQTYPARLEALCPQLQVVNMGLGGYGLDQAYLWYLRDGVELEADLLAFAFIAGDFHRMMYDNFQGYDKPVLRLEDGELRTDNVPVPHTWGRRRMWVLRHFVGELAVGRAIASGLGRTATDVRRRADDPQVFAGVAGRVLEELQQVSRQRGQDFTAIYLPVIHTLSEEPTAQARWAEDFTGRAEIRFLNLTSDFSSLSLREVRRLQLDSDPHYSADGNRFVAERLLIHLRRHFPDLPC